MNLAFQDLALDDFRYNVKFLEKKRNLIMDGDFVKLVYSDDSMSINSIFFMCTLKCKYDDAFLAYEKFVKREGESSPVFDKCTIWFSPYDPINQPSIKKLIGYEQAMIEEYKDQTNCLKTPTSLLKNQLLSGNVRLYRLHGLIPITTMMVKISGIWESNEQFGITYKFIECT